MDDKANNRPGDAVQNEPSNGLSRRSFIRTSAAGLGVAATGLGASSLAVGQEAEIPSIKMAYAFEASLAEAPKPGEFAGKGMSGAEIFAQLCKQEELSALFCCPGNSPDLNALAAAGIPSDGGRT